MWVPLAAMPWHRVTATHSRCSKLTHSPQNLQGAARLSRDVLDPAAKQAAPLVDLGLANLALLFSNPVLAGAEARLQSLAAQFPVLEWFMRRPSGRF